MFVLLLSKGEPVSVKTQSAGTGSFARDQLRAVFTLPALRSRTSVGNPYAGGRTSVCLGSVYFGDWPRASEGITSVSFDLPKRGHSLLPSSAGTVGGGPTRSFISPAKRGCEIPILVLGVLRTSGTMAVPSVRRCFHNFMAIGSGLMLIPFHSPRLFRSANVKTQATAGIKKNWLR
jgi:hypothetical protein